jgi:hypothetical protein
MLCHMIVSVCARSIRALGVASRFTGPVVCFEQGV